VRDVALTAIVLLGFVWILAVSFGIVGRVFKLTSRRDWVGRVARVCAAVDLLSP
jgi:hypothetical protein